MLLILLLAASCDSWKIRNHDKELSSENLMPSWEETEHYEIVNEEVEDIPEITNIQKLKYWLEHQQLKKKSVRKCRCKTSSKPPRNNKRKSEKSSPSWKTTVTSSSTWAETDPASTMNTDTTQMKDVESQKVENVTTLEPMKVSVTEVNKTSNPSDGADYFDP
ncbi:uncharacterized protein LOC111717882 isoform X2 [Eurytemora carolleeae]|uniref:uncharacterized protein LOC111717882 isoform X2 n=1 Tax=Eurytemora carolleeae TaxID=1294199 RepID=UPI000C76C4A1|nr:uncharacterized protein LOC111717882 isoform X2 [Eurytemora carolleeae]|eukprot:XP_023349113.1 uncharacterized protein LOC111717882 isoform X2 [Eurytemora affinis]